GAVVGATIITLLQQYLQDVLPLLLGTAGNFEVVVFGVLVIVLLQRARDGVWPWIGRLLPRAAPPPLQASVTILPRRTRPVAAGVLLEVRKLRKAFGGLVAVNELSFTLQASEIVALIGPNGAGKSTTFALLSGALAMDGGDVLLDGQSIAGCTPYAIARRGIARTFQHVKLVGTMSVLDNVALGAYLRGRSGVVRAALRLDRREEAQVRAEALRQIERCGLATHAYAPAHNLALGQQRVVEIARALAADPALLLLDEPAAGLRYAEKQVLATLLRDLRSEGMTILLVEHDMQFVMDLADRVIVMDFGEKLAEGEPTRIQHDPAVVEAYLGAAAA
ncbi:MAG: ABC transporter ATP-binding protein, partial [Casimicrobiaceae bacterium]